MKSFLRSALAGVCLGLTVLTGFAGVIGGSVCAALIYARVQEGRWQERDLSIFWTSFCVGAAGALLTWLLIALRNWLRGPREKRLAPSLEKQRRDRRIANAFGALIWAGGFCWLIWQRSALENPWLRAAQTAGVAAAGALILHLEILLHELGHLGVAWALGLDLRKIQVGTGRVLWRRQGRPGGLRWEWRLAPGGGLMLALHRRHEGFRWRHWLVVAGGPLVNLAMLWVGYAWIVAVYGDLETAWQARGVVSAAACALLGWRALLAFSGLVPQKVHLNGTLHHTDGWWLLRLPGMKEEAVSRTTFLHALMRADAAREADQPVRAWEIFEQARALRPDKTVALACAEGVLRRDAKDLAGAAQCYERALAQPDILPEQRTLAQAELAVTLAEAGRLEEARQICTAAIEQTPLEKRFRLLDHFASLFLQRDMKILAPDALGWIEQALAAEPTPSMPRSALLHTRAALRIELGQLDPEAEASFRELYAKGTPRERAFAAFYLARLARRRPAPAREQARWRRRALRHGEEAGLEKRIRAELFADPKPAADATAAPAAPAPPGANAEKLTPSPARR